MADPVSITGLVLQVGVLVKQLYDYGKQVKSARKDINSLCAELVALRGILEDLKDHRAEPDDENRLSAILSNAQTLLSELLRRLSPGADQAWHLRAAQSMRWPWDRSSVDEILVRLERIKSALVLTLMDDHRSALDELSVLMKEDVGSIKSEVREIRTIVADEVSLRDRERQRRALEKFRERVAPVSPAVTHTKVCSAWQGRDAPLPKPPGTWFIDGHLRPWLSNSVSREDESENGTTLPQPRLMALCGASGAGKSTIVSSVIEQLMSNTDHDDDITPRIAYFYCTYNEIATHSVRSVFGSWLVQLLPDDDVPSLRRPWYSELAHYVDRDKEIPVELLSQAIARVAEDMAANFTLLVIDAVNESKESGNLLAAILELLRSTAKLRCLMSTTTKTAVLQDPLCTAVTMSPDSIRDDVTEFLKRQVAAHEILGAVGEQEILAAIVPRTQGMFRWASCQINILAEYPTVKMARRALEHMPGTLDDTYSILLQRVPLMFKGLVREALLWLSYAFRPLSLSELAEAIVIEVGEKSIDGSCRIYPLHRVLDLCHGLIVWDEDSDEVSLAHSSVATFLQSASIRTSAAAFFAIDHSGAVSLMTRKSLSYLLMDEFRNGPCSWDTLVERYTEFPLLDYAATMWAKHTSDLARADPRLGKEEVRMILNLFHTQRILPNGGNFAFWVQCLLPFSHVVDIRETVPLYYAASFGLTPLVAIMFHHGYINTSDPDAPWYIDKACGGQRATPLNIACYRGHLDVVKILLSNGADPNTIDALGVSGRALARVHGHFSVARLMRQYGGVERDDFGSIKNVVDPTYSPEEQDDISGDDSTQPPEMPRNWLHRYIKRKRKDPSHFDMDIFVSRDLHNYNR